jgi:NAD-dependent SIR2 family protein deacetylase
MNAATKNIENNFRQAAELLAGADALVLAAGAGMGVDSGLPDFRGNTGFWQAYPALAKANLHFSEIASPLTFAQDPRLAWGFYGHRLALYRQTVPHPGFDILRLWGQNMPLGVHVFTSNVDGQFQKAGFLDDQVHECHGAIHQLQCTQECGSGVWSADGFVPEVDTDNCRLLNTPPHCPACGALARPNVLMFNDWSWVSKRSDAQARREATWLDTLAENRARVVVLELGAGTAIPSVRRFSHRIIHEFGGRLVRINPSDTTVPGSMDVGLAVGALQALRGMEMAMRKQRMPPRKGERSHGN